MGAEIKRQIKTFNGVDYDKILAMLNDSVALRELNFTEFFGIRLANDVIISNDAAPIQMGAIYTGLKQSTDYAKVTISSDTSGPGYCKILKSGYYLVIGDMRVIDTTNNTAFEVKVTGSTSGEIAYGSGARAWNIRVLANCCGIAKLTANEILKLEIVRLYGGGSYRLESGRTSLRVYPLYIPD